MRIIERMKQAIRSWLQIQPANPQRFNITETLDYESNAIKNRIWYRGEADELAQLYAQLQGPATRRRFWAAQSTPGMEIRKIHTGIPALIVDMLAHVTLSKLEIAVGQPGSPEYELWQEIAKDSQIRKRIEKAVKETLYIGDGAFKISFDNAISPYPIIEYYPGDRLELTVTRGRIREITFFTVYPRQSGDLILHEIYGRGYVRYELYDGDKQVPTDSIPETADLVDVTYDGDYMLAVPIRFYESGRWDERGQSIYDKKIDAFDSLDEAWSQWVDALRAGRAREYIPEDLVPRDPETGAVMAPNPFDNRYIKTLSDMREGAQAKIEIEQPSIPHDSYLSTYITALDLALQGLISPSTLGIDVKKLDNAEAQREKEKTTLYTRDTITDALQIDIPALIETTLRAYATYNGQAYTEPDINVSFGEYANPSFESQVETIAKARTARVMSIEATIDELYGDSKDDDWKAEEVQRLKDEAGYIDADPGDFSIEDKEADEEAGDET